MSLAATLQKPFVRAHHWLYIHTDGRVGHRLVGAPTLLLRTVGRKSFQERTNALVYASDSAGYYVVPSNGGADRPPGWLFNLQAAPEVHIQIGRKRMPAVATAISQDDPEHQRLWTLVNRVNRNQYEKYQKMTQRPIPLVRLTPTDRPR